MNILLTGASGFIGSHLMQSLRKDENHSLYGLTRQSSVQTQALPCPTVYWEDFSADYLNKQGIEAIIHLAGLAHAEKGNYAPEDYMQVNTGLTEKLYDAFQAAGKTSQFIYFSSVKAVRDYLNNETLTEQTEPAPTTPYGISKLKAEEYLNAIAHGEKDVFILRPCMVYGRGNKGNLDLLAKVLKKNLPFPLGAFQNQRSFLYIENLKFVIKSILEGQVAPGTYNMADSTPLATTELVEVLKEQLDSRSAIWKVPQSLIKSIAALGDVLPIPLNSERLQKLTENYVVDNQKLLRALGKPLPYDTVEGLKSTFS